MAQAFHGPDRIETGIREFGVCVILLLEGHPVGDTLLLRVAVRASDLAGYRSDAHHLHIVGLRQPDSAATNAASGIEDALPLANTEIACEYPIHGEQGLRMAAGVL